MSEPGFIEELKIILGIFQQEVITTAFEDEKPNPDSPKLWKQDDDSFAKAITAIKQLILKKLPKENYDEAWISCLTETRKKLEIE